MGSVVFSNYLISLLTLCRTEVELITVMGKLAKEVSEVGMRAPDYVLGHTAGSDMSQTVTGC